MPLNKVCTDFDRLPCVRHRSNACGIRRRSWRRMPTEGLSCCRVAQLFTIPANWGTVINYRTPIFLILNILFCCRNLCDSAVQLFVPNLFRIEFHACIARMPAYGVVTQIVHCAPVIERYAFKPPASIS